MQAEQLIDNLIAEVQQIITRAEAMKAFDAATQQRRPNHQSWNMLECLEHLNLYGHFYLPQMEAAIQQSKSQPDAVFKSGWLGGYFAKSMLPKEKLNKMKTFKNKNPLHAPLDQSVIDQFLLQQRQLLVLLQQSRKVSLNKVRVPTTLSRMITLKLGDAFPFLVNHMIRHFAQINRLEKAVQLKGTLMANH